jgi:hypothetical protein
MTVEDVEAAMLTRALTRGQTAPIECHLIGQGQRTCVINPTVREFEVFCSTPHFRQCPWYGELTLLPNPVELARTQARALTAHPEQTGLGGDAAGKGRRPCESASFRYPQDRNTHCTEAGR